MRNIVQQVLAAYENSGVLPARGVWQEHRFGGVRACGLGALLRTRGHFTGRYLGARSAVRVLGLSLNYVKGFTAGFDGRRIGSLVRTREFQRGRADGLRAWRESSTLRRQWRRGEHPIAIRRGIARAWAGIARGMLAKEREIIAVGLEELGGTCAYAAREAGIVEAALADIQALVVPTKPRRGSIVRAATVRSA